MPDTPELIAARKKALELNKNVRTSPPVVPRQGGQNSLGTILTDNGATIKYSDSGNGGAILVQPGPNMNGMGAAIKIESMPSVVNAQKCGQLMETFFANAKGTPPFATPRTAIYTVNEFQADASLSTGLGAKLNELETRGSIQQQRGFDNQKTALGNVSKGTAGVLVMELADGKQVDKLPIDEKVGLVKSEAFARSIGRAMAPSMALGLVDHVGTGLNNFAPNITNLMYDSATGKLSIIDYDGRVTTSGDPEIIRVGVGSADKELEGMRLFLEDASQSPQKFEAAIDRIVASMTDNKIKTPFTGMLRSFTPGSLNRMFEGPNRALSKNQKLALTQDEIGAQVLSPEDYREFAANLLVGAAEGLEYVQSNQQALETAVKQTHDVQHGQNIDHFYSAADMQRLKTELGKLDPDKLKKQMSQRMDERANAQKTELGTLIGDLNKKENDLNQKLATVQAKSTQVGQFPSAGDKLKAIFSSKDKTPLAKLNKEAQKIKDELVLVADLKSVAQSKLDFSQKMEGQKQLLPQKAQTNTVSPQTPTVKTQLATPSASVKSQANTPPPSVKSSLGKDTGVTQDTGKVDLRNAQGNRATARVRDATPTPSVKSSLGKDAGVTQETGKVDLRNAQGNKATPRVRDAISGVGENKPTGNTPKKSLKT